MFEVGQKVVCVETGSYTHLTIGKIYDVVGFWGIGGVTVIDDKGIECHMLSSRFKPHTETEAEKRGAKFGVTGVSTITGRKVRFVADDGKKSIHGQPLWVFLNEETQSIMRLRPSEVRFDHEPEFVAWVDAPEHLRYDASRVYFDGKPVKWIAKPEGCYGSDVVFVAAGGCLRCGTFSLTVKL